MPRGCPCHERLTSTSRERTIAPDAGGVDDGVMKLQRARLCIDCEELHEEQQCPVCASEVFVFVTQWVPARTPRPQSPPQPSPGYSNTQKAVGIGIAGVGLWGLAQWLTKGRKVIEDAATRGDVGELK